MQVYTGEFCLRGSNVHSIGYLCNILHLVYSIFYFILLFIWLIHISILHFSIRIHLFIWFFIFYLWRSVRIDDKPQTRTSHVQPPPTLWRKEQVPTLDQSCEDYVDLLRKKYGLWWKVCFWTPCNWYWNGLDRKDGLYCSNYCGFTSHLNAFFSASYHAFV